MSKEAFLAYALERKSRKWKSLDFIDFENYQISNDGYIRNAKTKNIKRFRRYTTIELYKDNQRKVFRISDLMKMAWCKEMYL